MGAAHLSLRRGGSARASSTRPAHTANVTATPRSPAIQVATHVLSTPLGAVVGERAVGERVLGDAGVDARVGGHLLQAVRVRVGVGGDEHDEDDGDGQADEHERPCW